MAESLFERVDITVVTGKKLPSYVFLLLKVATTLVDLLFIELMLHHLQVNQMLQSIKANHK